MKKILISVSIIAAAAAVIVGATTAYFSDTETSTGNTFTAGSLDLKVDSQCHRYQLVAGSNGEPVPSPVACPTENTWGQNGGEDIENQKFFTIYDVKPGDSGENTISLHVDNDAWLQLVVGPVSDLENSCTEPEAAEEGGTCDGTGELRENLLFTVFADGVLGDGTGGCNNIKDSNDSELISAGTINADGETWPLPTFIPGGKTSCFGISWNLPTTVGNVVQSDSLSAAMTLNVEQFRNNPTPSWSLIPSTP